MPHVPQPDTAPPDPKLLDRVRKAARQEQFLHVVDAEEAARRWHAALDLRPLAAETVPLAAASGRVVASTIAAAADAPPFDRDLRSASLDHANLIGADLGGASFAGASLRYADLSDANKNKGTIAVVQTTDGALDLSHADLTGAQLVGADLTGANLTQATLRGASLEGAILKGANLTGANFCGADLRKVD